MKCSPPNAVRVLISVDDPCGFLDNGTEKSLLVTGFPYDTWNTPQDNFANFEKFGKMTQGVRRLGSAALDLCYVAAGRFDGFWEMSLKPWDVAAGGLICKEAGAIVTNINGVWLTLFLRLNLFVAAAPGIQSRMLEELENISSDGK